MICTFYIFLFYYKSNLFNIFFSFISYLSQLVLLLAESMNQINPTIYCSWVAYVTYNWSDALSFILFLIVFFSPHDSGADSPTCSNGVTPTNKNKSHNKYTGVSSASSSPSSSPSSVNYSESNSTDSTKSQPHSATSNQETRSVLLFGLVIGFFLWTRQKNRICGPMHARPSI